MNDDVIDKMRSTAESNFQLGKDFRACASCLNAGELPPEQVLTVAQLNADEPRAAILLRLARSAEEMAAAARELRLAILAAAGRAAREMAIRQSASGGDE